MSGHTLLSLTLSIGALSRDAHAQGCTSAPTWTTRTVFFGSPGTDIPVAVSMRAWGPTNEVFFVYERRFPTQTDMPHGLYLKDYTCSTNPYCGTGMTPNTFPQQEVQGKVYHDQFAQPAIAIDTNTGGVRKLAIVSRKRVNYGCDGDSTAYLDESLGDPEARRLDLTEAQWHSDGSSTNSYQVEIDPPGDNLCTDRSAPYTRYHEDYGRARACWQWDDDKPTYGEKQEIHCGRRNSDGSYSVIELANGDPDTSGILVDQTAVAFDLNDGTDTRVVVHRTGEGNIGKLRVRFPDDTLPANFILATDDPDSPDIVQSSTGVWHIVWHEGYGGHSKIKHAWCTPVLPGLCRSFSNWTIELVEDDDFDLMNPQINTDGERIFITYMADVSDGQYRIQYKTRCNNGVTQWEMIPPANVCTPNTATEDQSLLLGRPSTALDRGDNVFHVGYLQVDAISNLSRHNDADVLWSSKVYSDCP